MSPRPDCEHARSLAAEIALGIATGEERASALAHVAGCAICKREIAELGETADEVLSLGAHAEPPAGFESAVLDRTVGTRTRARPWRAVAAIVIAAVVSGAGVMAITSDDRELAADYRQALAQANGTYFGAFSLVGDGAEEAGDAFVYNGEQPWIFVVFYADMPAGRYEAELLTHAGEHLALGSFELSPDDLEWGTKVSVDLREVRAARVTSEDTTATYVASFDDH